MVIEPPCYLRRVRVLEVYDDILIAIKQVANPGLRRSMGHAAEAKLRAMIKTLLIKTVEERCGSGAVKTAVVEAQAYAGHEKRNAPFYPSARPNSEDKALNDGWRREESQAKIRTTIGARVDEKRSNRNVP
jgi:hypothetical protein